MKNKIRNEYSKLFKIISFDIGILVLLLILSILRFLELIKFSFIIINFITLIVCWFSSLIYLLKMSINQKKVGINRFIMMFVFLSFGLFLAILETNIDKKIFLRDAQVTTATIVNVNKSINRRQKTETRYSSSNRTNFKTYKKTYYEVKFEYQIYYNINDKNYNNKITNEYDYTSSNLAETANPDYNKGENITIYYNINDPYDIRTNIDQFPSYIFLIIAIILELISIFFININYKKDIKKYLLKNKNYIKR